ncbi:MAG: chloride channel protein [Myxococcaceae bacterium]
MSSWFSSSLDRARAVSGRVRVRAARWRERGVALVRRALPFESQHLFALTLLVGVVCGVVAVAFHLAIRAAERMLIERALDAPGQAFIVWTIVSPMLGGLVAGALLTWVVPGARGSGIPQVKTAFAQQGGRVPFRDAFGKFWIAALQIGSGASLGREGPTVQICAGATSLLARATALPRREMRRLLPVGVAAGIAAAFNAPIAAVTFTIEEIVGSLDHAVLSGVVVAAALAAVIERGVLGEHPIIEVDQAYGLDHASSLVLFAALGILAGLLSVVFTDGLLEVRARFKVRKRANWANPAIGGLVTGGLAAGTLALFHERGIAGGGYETLAQALAGGLGLRALVVLMVVKLIATVFSYSSGGAGGIFAPSLFVGAMLGGLVGHLDVALFDHESRQLGAFALVGMGAVFAGVIRAPITSVLIIFEMTGGYGLVLPLMLANMTSYALARRLRPTPIYEALLEQDGITLPHAVQRAHALDQLTVSDAMTRDVRALPASLTVAEARARLTGVGFASVPVLDASERLAGVVSLADLAAAEPSSTLASVARRAESVLASASLGRAVVQMNERSVRVLFALDEDSATRVVGVVSMSDLVRAHAKALPAASPRRTPTVTHLEAVTATELAVELPTIPPTATLDDVVEALGHASLDGVVVRDDGGAIKGAVLLEHVRELLADEAIHQLLAAVDVARPLVTVSADAPLQVLARACVDQSVAGAVLPDGRVITSRLVGAALLDWYARGTA